MPDHRNQTVASSNVSIDDSSKDSFISNSKSYGNLHGHYANHISLLNSKNASAFVSPIDGSIERIERVKYENDKNATLINGDSRSFGIKQGNKYHTDVDDDNASHTTALTNPFPSRLDDATLKSRNTQNPALANQSNGHSNQASESIGAHTNGTKAPAGNGKSGEPPRRESINGFNSRRNSRINDENSLLNEKISDIFVNRMPGKLYNNTVGGSIYNNLLYNGGLGSNASTEHGKRSQDFGFKNKAFFLHENSESTTDSGYGSKVYNIFSKQPSKPHDYGPDAADDDDDNSYLLVKIPSGAKKQSRKSVSVLDQANLFEDDDLDKLLG